MTTATTAPPPRAAGGRLAHVDALRGFALLGILVVNIGYLASAYHGTGLEDPGFTSPLDNAVRWFVTVFFEAKFFLLFSFLFGYSFTLQLSSAERHGARFASRFLRRLAGLFVLGALHAVLLFPGDILTTYAVLGLILLAARHLRPRTAVYTAAALFVLTAVAYAVLALSAHAAGGSGVDPATAAGAERATEALRGGPASVVAAHLEQLPDVLILLVLFQAPAALAAFLLGLAAGRRQALGDIARHRGTLGSLQWAGFTLGLFGGVVYAHASLEHPGSPYQILAMGIDVVTAPLLAAAYAATVLRLARGRYADRLIALLAPAGRMTLTNYLAQSLVCALLFTGYGLALVGDVPPLAVLAIALVLFTAQAAASRWWLRRHHYGPLEWLLRAWTTLTWSPLRLPAAHNRTPRPGPLPERRGARRSPRIRCRACGRRRRPRRPCAACPSTSRRPSSSC
ncbi:DUF418 domain-containing protein [Streptomyces alboniger]|uniref:DUF418 domain-containing protein n=1 Tax=Streptomyces alboniger TaxID=132473 RepID=A0A5J6HNI7_STRAD|nr:DUF418 domain-containing protein [Streptomyces alboniger]QEV21786.1 DUF418 domain-containing protein [Streptomyces alboniger]